MTSEDFQDGWPLWWLSWISERNDFSKAPGELNKIKKKYMYNRTDKWTLISNPNFKKRYLNTYVAG